MNGLLLAKGKQHDVITYVAVKLLKTSFYKNFHCDDDITSINYFEHLQMWPAKESASNNNLQTKHKMRLMCAIFCASVLDQVLG